jgi:hypothetical protein
MHGALGNPKTALAKLSMKDVLPTSVQNTAKRNLKRASKNIYQKRNK